MEDMELELGSLLKKAREKKGLSIEDIQEKTKIRKKYIEAIEENKFEILPGTVYLKVFVKGYAREVGLDYQNLLSNYEALNIKEKRKSKLDKDYLDGTKISHSSKNNNKSKKKPLKIIMIMLLILFLTAASLYTYQYFSNADVRLLNQEKNKEIIQGETKGKTEENKKTVEIEKDEKLLLKDELESLTGLSENKSNIEEDAEIIIPKDGVLDNKLGSSGEDLEIGTEEENFNINDLNLNLNGDNSSAAKIKNNNLKTEDESKNETKSKNEKSDLISAEQDKIEKNIAENKLNNISENILIKASDTVWITVDLDDKNIFSGILEDNDQLDFEFKENLYIKIGNGEAITVNIQGKEYGPWAASGQIAEVEIIKDEGEIIVNNLRD